MYVKRDIRPLLSHRYALRNNIWECFYITEAFRCGISFRGASLYFCLLEKLLLISITCGRSIDLPEMDPSVIPGLAEPRQSIPTFIKAFVDA